MYETDEYPIEESLIGKYFIRSPTEVGKGMRFGQFFTTGVWHVHIDFIYGSEEQRQGSEEQVVECEVPIIIYGLSTICVHEQEEELWNCEN